MRAFIYLNLRLLKNTVVAILTNPRQVVPAVFILSPLIILVFLVHTLEPPPILPDITTETVKPAIFSFLTFIMWVTVIQSTTRNTLIFSLPEIDFLFPSPLKRKTILLNRLLMDYMKTAVQYLGVTGFILYFLSQFYTFSLARIFFSWLALLLALIFASNVGGIVSMVSSHYSDVSRQRNRRILSGAALLFVGALFFYVYYLVVEGASLKEGLVQALNSSVVRIFMYPLAAASDVAVAWTFTADINLKIVFLLALCFVSTWGVLSMETHFYESSEASSRELWESLQKIKRQEVVVSESFVKKMLKIRPFGRGSTVLIWKNLTGTIRDIRMLVPTFLMALFFFVLMVFRGGRSYGSFFLPFFLILITTGYIRWDFREDLRRIEIVKLIPDSSFRIVLSEIAVPAGFSTFVSYIYLGLIFFVVPDTDYRYLLTVFSLPALPVFSLIVVTILNLAALYYPPQTSNQVIPGVMTMLATMVVVGPSVGLGLMLVVLGQVYVGLAAVVVMNAVIAVVLLKLLARKYRIFELA